MRAKRKLVSATGDRRKLSGAVKRADHHLTHSELWLIMETCAQPEVSKAIRALKPAAPEGSGG